MLAKPFSHFSKPFLYFQGAANKLTVKKLWYISKVEKNLKGSSGFDPSPSPSVKIQIMGGKVCFRCKGKTLPYYLK